MQNTYYLQAGHKTAITADADATDGYYQVLNNPGEAPETAVAIAGGATVNLGPYNTGRFYRLSTKVGKLNHAEEFGGYATTDMNEEPATNFQIGEPFGDTVESEEAASIWKRTVLTLTDTAIALTDEPGVGQYGGVKIYDFPPGLINIQGAVINGVLTAVAPIIDAFTGVVALGSAPATTGATLVGTEADFLQSNAFTQAVAKEAEVKVVSSAAALTESGARWADGTGTAKDLYLNFLFADNAAHTSTTVHFTGTVELIWSVVGDI